MVRVSGLRQVVDVSYNPTARRERHDTHSSSVAVDGEVGEELFHELELVEEILSADAGRAVHKEHQLGLAVGRAS